MAGSTKERILEEALVCFSENGYKGTNLRDLAQRLGLSKSALYKHYQSKEDIWNSLLDMMERYYAERFGSMENLPPVPSSAEELVGTTMRMAEFTVRDRYIIMTRRILSVEQFRDERAAALATEHFINATQRIFAFLFSEMMKNGCMKDDDPELLAFAYTAPVSALIHLCDREPEKTDEALERIKAFAEHFAKVYMK